MFRSTRLAYAVTAPPRPTIPASTAEAESIPRAYASALDYRLLTVSTLKEKLRSDLTAAMKSRDELTRATLRMAMAAVQTAEVSGSRARDLSDEEVLSVIRREVKKRHESAETYAAAGRQELAGRELAEAGVLEGYLPRQLDDHAVRDLVAAAIAESGAQGPRDMGKAMGLAKQSAGAEVDGKRLSTEVSRQLRDLAEPCDSASA